MARLTTAQEYKLKQDLPAHVQAFIDAGGVIEVAPRNLISTAQKTLEDKRRLQAQIAGRASAHSH